MKQLIIIPAYNEEEFIGKTLTSLTEQTHPADKIIVVNDHSSDRTANIVMEFCQKHSYIELVQNPEKSGRDVGAKVVRVFNQGLQSVNWKAFDIIMKMDADLQLPCDYLATITSLFQSSQKVGLAGGICVVKKEGDWINEAIASLDHVRGALKSYRKDCFQEIGGLRPILGWDVIDEYLCRYHGWEVRVLPQLQVKHFRTTNKEGNWKNLSLRSGRSMYRMRYGPVIAFTSAMKRGLKRPPRIISGVFTYFGFLKALFTGEKPVVSREVGRFIRKYRWEKLYEKFRPR